MSYLQKIQEDFLKYRLFIGSYKNYRINRKYRRSGPPPCALFVYAPLAKLCGICGARKSSRNYPYSPDGVLLDISWAMGFFKGQTFKLNLNFQRGKGGALNLKSLFRDIQNLKSLFFLDPIFQKVASINVHEKNIIYQNTGKGCKKSPSNFKCSPSVHVCRLSNVLINS